MAVGVPAYFLIKKCKQVKKVACFYYFWVTNLTPLTIKKTWDDRLILELCHCPFKKAA